MVYLNKASKCGYDDFSVFIAKYARFYWRCLASSPMIVYYGNLRELILS